LLGRSRLRGGLKRRRFILYGSYKEEVIAANRSTEGSDPKYDLISNRKGDFFKDIAADEGCQDVCDGEHDVACACNVCAKSIGDGFGEEGIKANAERRERDRHEKGEHDDGCNLTRVIKY